MGIDGGTVLRGNPPLARPIRLMSIVTQRKRNSQERRRALCDAGIQVLAEQGSRGLTHQKVDHLAGVAEGTTSYYYRTRAALLHGISERVDEIDTENLLSWINQRIVSGSPFARLAQLTVMQADGPGLVLNKARYELMLYASRDAVLSEAYQGFVARLLAMTRHAVAQFQLPGNSHDDALLDAQCAAVTTFIGGVFTRFIAGDRTIADAEQLDRLLRAIVVAVSLEYADDAALEGVVGPNQPSTAPRRASATGSRKAAGVPNKRAQPRARR